MRCRKLGWIGAGRKGFEIAERLANAGAVLVWNRTKEKPKPLEKNTAIAEG